VHGVYSNENLTFLVHTLITWHTPCWQRRCRRS